MGVRVVACCCLLALAGCAGLLGGGTAPTTETLTPAPAPTPSPTVTPRGPPAPPVAQVAVVGVAAPPVRVLAVDRLANRPVVNETVVGKFDVTYDAAGAFEPRRTYDVSLRVGGRVAWAATVRETERYGLLVEADGTVTVRAYTAV